MDSGPFLPVPPGPSLQISRNAGNEYCPEAITASHAAEAPAQLERNI